MVFDNMSTKEELLAILQLKGHTRGEDIFQAFMEFDNKFQLPFCKLVSITTDGAPAMGMTSAWTGPFSCPANHLKCNKYFWVSGKM